MNVISSAEMSNGQVQLIRNTERTEKRGREKKHHFCSVDSEFQKYARVLVGPS
jgi:hypothetical protein